MARLVDRGAIFAGWVGFGMALIIVIALALIIPIQSIVFIAAPLAGVLIGVYANVRSERWRPRGRVLANAAYAGLVTGVSLAVLYVLIRLLFVFADSGLRPDGTQIACRPGPDCAYQRYVELGRGPDLVGLGITDAASFEAAVVREQLAGGSTLIVLALGGALVGGAIRAVRSPARPAEAAATA